MNLFPKKIYKTKENKLAIEWIDGHKSIYGLKYLREACSCARCRDELTGENHLRPGDIPEDIKPVVLQNVGKYAMQIYWSDGHSSGIYTYLMLRKICQSPL